MVVRPWYSGSLVIKSRETWGTGNRCKRPAGAWCEGLCWSQTGQAPTNSRVSSRVALQNLCCTPFLVLRIPRWQVSLEFWAHWRTSDRRVARTNRLSGGQALAPLRQFSPSPLPPRWEKRARWSTELTHKTRQNKAHRNRSSHPLRHLLYLLYFLYFLYLSTFIIF